PAVHRDLRKAEERPEASGRLRGVLGADDEALEPERRRVAGRLARRWRGQLDEHAAAGARVEERDLAGEPGARRGVDQLRAAILEAHQRAADVRRLEAEMVEALAVPREEAPDARGRVARLEQLDLRVAGGEQRRAHALLGDRPLLEQPQAEHVAIKLVAFGETPDG